MSDDVTLEQIAAGNGGCYCDEQARTLARELIALRTRAEGRLDSHNRIMESIVRRVRVLEGGGATTSIGDVMHRLTNAERDAREAQEQADGWRFNHGEAVKRAETAERERDLAIRESATVARLGAQRIDELNAARASVERLRGYARHAVNCDGDHPSGHYDCTCGITAALEDA